MTTKKALLIGINYKGTSNQLNGCINDVINMKTLLTTKYGYKEEDITTITDDTELKPTRKNILSQFLNLILSDAKNMFFHYSGHGAYVIDKDLEESDGRDETLVPLDYETNGMIIDDEIKGLLQCLSTKSQLTAVLDCCHSGSGMDLCYNLYERVGAYSMIKDTKQKETKGQVVMLSGCLDSQTSADTFVGGQGQGALTYSIITSLKNFETTGTVPTYDMFVRAVKKVLSTGGYSQVPSLSSGKVLSLTNTLSF